MNEPGPSAATMPPQVSYDWLQRRIVFAAVAFALALLAVQAFQAWHGYRTARTEAERRAANLVYILSAHMQEAVAALDASLVQIAAASARLGGPSGDADDWNAVLMGAIAGLLNTGSLSVTDSQGVIRHATVASILGQSRQDLYLFQTLRRQANAGMVADRPYKGVSGEMLIPLGRRLEGPADTFQGVAVATLRLQQLREFYRSIDVGPGGLIRILHPDGQVLFREPSSREPIGDPALEDPVYLAYRAGKADGLLNEESGPNGRPLITAFHALPSPGLLLAVSLDRGAASAEWRNKLAVDGGLLAAEILVLASATTIILQLLRARHAATVRLASRERQLLLAESIAHMGAVTFDIATATVRPSPQIAAIFGWPDPVEEIPLQAFLAAVHEADRQPLETNDRAVCRRRRAVSPGISHHAPGWQRAYDLVRRISGRWRANRRGWRRRHLPGCDRSPDGGTPTGPVTEDGRRRPTHRRRRPRLQQPADRDHRQSGHAGRMARRGRARPRDGRDCADGLPIAAPISCAACWPSPESSRCNRVWSI